MIKNETKFKDILTNIEENISKLFGLSNNITSAELKEFTNAYCANFDKSLIFEQHSSKVVRLFQQIQKLFQETADSF